MNSTEPREIPYEFPHQALDVCPGWSAIYSSNGDGWYSGGRKRRHGAAEPEDGERY